MSAAALFHEAAILVFILSVFAAIDLWRSDKWWQALLLPVATLILIGKLAMILKV